MECSRASIIILVLSCTVIESKVFTRCQLTRELLKYKVDRTFMSNWVCLVQYVSKRDTAALVVKSATRKHYGLFQIGNEWCKEGGKGGKCDISCEAFLDDDIWDDAACAKKILLQEGFEYWTGWEARCKGHPIRDILKDQRDENGNAYGIRSNIEFGDTQRAPPWPEQLSDSEIVFLLPKILRSGDQIAISGRLRSNPKNFTISLVTGNSSPDYSNTAFQLEARFPPSNEDKILLKTVNNGDYEEFTQYITATEWISNSTFSCTMTLKGTYDGNMLVDVLVGEAALDDIELKHSVNDIRYLALHGDIEKVDKIDYRGQ